MISKIENHEFSVMEGADNCGSCPTSEAITETLGEMGSQQFQKFVYELFEKNGIMNDLRSYLRKHIINVLTSAQTGEVPRCQKHFAQRLELSSQALNVLIVEYLLRLDFSYTLSVFVSEIPLTNMVFDFCKNLSGTGTDRLKELRFNDTDIWAILNYLGVKCDSEYACSVVDMYKGEQKAPLLLCVLKSMTPSRLGSADYPLNFNLSPSSSSLSADERPHTPNTHKRYSDRCPHYDTCRSCQNRFARLREKYQRKTNQIAEKQASISSMQGEILMKNMTIVEHGLLDETIEQLRSGYQNELDMVRAEEDKRVKRTLARHALTLKQQRDQMEESFRERSHELERGIVQKKRFLWGLARALRDQHMRLARAMIAVAQETRRLAQKEVNIKGQIAEAEEKIRKHGEDLRTQISHELLTLKSRLDTMKQERTNLQKERQELETQKNLNMKTGAILKVGESELKLNLDSIKNEIGMLKKCIMVSKNEPRCVVESSTATEESEVAVKNPALNNEGERCGRDEGVKPPNQVVNDFKKQKNVNFDQPHKSLLLRHRPTPTQETGECLGCHTGPVQARVEEMLRDVRRSLSPNSEAGDAHLSLGVIDPEPPSLRALREENERLKALARLQEQQISTLSSQRAQLQAELSQTRSSVRHSRSPPRHPVRSPEHILLRPRTAPASLPPPADLPRPHGVHTVASVNSVSCRGGAGEEARWWGGPPAILRPGDTLPFVGELRGNHADGRKQLMAVYRGRRSVLRATSPNMHRRIDSVAGTTGASGSSKHRLPESEQNQSPSVRDTSHTNPKSDSRHNETEKKKNREKSPKSVLREAKLKLKTNSSTKSQKLPREKSPTEVLREAKLRLRKLEIEAEAVEKSYRDFRRRQTEINRPLIPCADLDVNLGVVNANQTHHAVDGTPSEQAGPSQNELITTDHDKLIKEYQVKFNLTETHFKNRNAVEARIKPIPIAFSNKPDSDEQTPSEDFLEKPLDEFRKLYQNSPASSSADHQSTRLSVQSNHSKSPSSFGSPTVIDSKENDKENKELDDRIDSYQNRIEERELQDKIEQNELHAKKKTEVKKAELEILKQNINKMYNIPMHEMDSSNSNQGSIEKLSSVTENSNKNKSEETPKVHGDGANQQIQTAYDSKHIDKMSESGPQNVDAWSSEKNSEKNSDESENSREEMNLNMTILISPKRSLVNNKTEDFELKSEKKRSMSPEQAARLTRNDVLDAIFHNNGLNETSSLDIANKHDSSRADDDYPDDFSLSADSPVSIPKYTDESFWES